MTTPRLSLRGLAKRYGDLVALAPCDLELPAGSVHGILGENGAGKSTLVRLIAGVARPDAGTIVLDGVPITPGDPRAARASGIGVVHQHFALVGALSVAENLALGRPEATGAWLAPKRLVAAARALAAEHGLEIGDPSAPCDSLPVGMQARIEILRALSVRPRVLLLDEPTANLDIAHQIRILALLRSLAHGCRMAVAVVTHDLNLASEFADRVVLLADGQVRGCGTPKEILTPERIESVFGTPVLVDANPVTGAPRITVLAGSDPHGALPAEQIGEQIQ